MRRIRLIALATGVATLGIGAAVAAQGAPPTVTIQLSTNQVTLVGAEALKGGPTRFVVQATDAPRGGGYEASILAVKAGHTVDEVRAALAGNDFGAVLSLGTLEMATDVTKAAKQRAVTITLTPGTNYVVAQSGGDDLAKIPLTSFATSAETSTAQAPAPAATVRMADFRFRGDAKLPRRGVVRFQNVGAAPHFAAAARLRKGATLKAIGAALKGPDRLMERRLSKLAVLSGDEPSPQGLITAGATNDQEMRFGKAGRYLLVCFFSAGPQSPPHSKLGMYRIVTVR